MDQMQHQMEADAATALRTQLGTDLPEPPLKALKEETYFALQEIGERLHHWADERNGEGQSAIAVDMTRANKLLVALGSIRDRERGGDDDRPDEVGDTESAAAPAVEEIDRTGAAGIANALKAHAVGMSFDGPYRGLALRSASRWTRLAEEQAEPLPLRIAWEMPDDDASGKSRRFISPHQADKLDEVQAVIERVLPDFPEMSPWGIALAGIAKELEAEIGPEDASVRRAEDDFSPEEEAALDKVWNLADATPHSQTVADRLTAAMRPDSDFTVEQLNGLRLEYREQLAEFEAAVDAAVAMIPVDDEQRCGMAA